MNSFSFQYKITFLAIALLILTGCLGAKGPSQQTKFYVLNSLYGLEKKETPVAKMPNITIGVGPVDLPKYINRPHIVTRAIQNEIQIEEFERWAEPIDSNFFRVLADNLSILLQTDNIVSFPAKRSTKVDYQVAVTVTRFDGVVGENALLRARWSIYGENGEKKLISKHSVYKQPVNGEELKDLVSAQSLALAHFSYDIAQAIASFEN
jgi:uncharacterized lipoprotein YmbA